MNVIVLYANLIVVPGNLSITLSVHKSTKIACVHHEKIAVLQSDRLFQKHCNLIGATMVTIVAVTQVLLVIISIISKAHQGQHANTN